MDQADRLRAISSSKGGATRVISVTSGKGGVGKTNVAVNTAILMGAKGLRVLLIDADIGLANAALMLGINNAKTIDDIMFGQSSIFDVFVKTPFGFDLLPSSSGVRKMLAMDNFSQRVLFDHLKGAMTEYDVVIFDTAPGLGDHVLNFNASAHDIVVVTHPEPTALMDAYALIKVLSEERKEKHFKLLVNRSRSLADGLDAFKKITDVADQFLSISIDFLGSIPEDPSVSDAVRAQRPAVIKSPKSMFGVALDRISDKLLSSAKRQKSSFLWDNDEKRVGS
ncbi:MAG TPA: MinD/ParA family protein [Bdellovibrionota bacterium]|nr:MinD/ParA family protein [Bdellovibrionota bacterium]